MVMKKQAEGVRRVRRAAETINGKPVTTEYTIFAGPPLVEGPEREIGFTRRIQHGSVSAWEAHPAGNGPDGKPWIPSEHKDHTKAVGVLIEALAPSRQVTDILAGTTQPKAPAATSEPPAPAAQAPAPKVRKPRGPGKKKLAAEKAPAAPVASTETDPGKAAVLPEPATEQESLAAALASSLGPPPGAPDTAPESTSPSSPESASAASSESFPDGGELEDAAALEEEVLDDVGLALAVADGSEIPAGDSVIGAADQQAAEWAAGYPEPRHDDPFRASRPDDDPFADPLAQGFIR
jgi:hypothetical protein